MTRVLIIDDSAYNRATLSRLLAGHPDLQVVGAARDGLEGIRMIRQHEPHVLTLDLEMPGMDGLSLLRWVMAEQPLPIVVVTSRESNYSLFQALELGALDFVLKPGRVSPDLPSIGEELMAKILQIGHARPRVERLVSQGAPVPRPRPPASLPAVSHGIRLIAMVSSTGGPQALQHILARLPADFPAAVALVQHMPGEFTGPFARRLDAICSLPVREARNGDLLRPGQILLAPGGRHLLVEGMTGSCFRMRVVATQEGDLHVPSGDLLLDSAARVAGEAAAGIVLTGMGHDGTRGISALAAAGGLAVAESERSAIVFGMPGNAIRAGMIDRVVPLESMAALMESMTLGCRSYPGEEVMAMPFQQGKGNP